MQTISFSPEVCRITMSTEETGSLVCLQTPTISPKCICRDESAEKIYKMFDCLSMCNSACIVCIWCILFSKCFSNNDNAKQADSSEYCSWKKPNEKRNISRFAQCCLSSTETLMANSSYANSFLPHDSLGNRFKYRVAITKDTLGPCIEKE